MRELLFGGLLYLAGVVIVLMIKPRLMFAEEGQWKEFGIGRNPKTHSWMPFWLFCILWALLSYALISVLIRTISANEYMPNDEVSLLQNNRSRQGLRASLNVPPATNGRSRSAYGDFEPGYYVLNRAASRRKGVPQYKYYGSPEMMEML